MIVKRRDADRREEAPAATRLVRVGPRFVVRARRLVRSPPLRRTTLRNLSMVRLHMTTEEELMNHLLQRYPAAIRAAALVVLLAGPAASQELEPPFVASMDGAAGGAGSARVLQYGDGITVFVDADFRGRSLTFDSDVPDVSRFGLNDRISSLRVSRGELWEACEHINYGGRCTAFSGSESDLRRDRWNDTISSLRRARGGRGGPGGPGGRGGRGWPSGRGAEPDGRIVLFTEPGFQGRSYRVDSASPFLSGFQDRAESVQVFGGSWQLCDDANYRGRCVTVTTSMADLGRLGLRNRVFSARPQPRGR